MIVTELMQSDLQTVLEDEEFQAPLLSRVRMAKDVALGMNWLHSNKPSILHRDLNPSNLLVDENLHVKIADYGLSRIRDETSSPYQSHVSSDAMDVDLSASAASLSASSMEIAANSSAKGTPYYMAPELFRNEPYTEKCDVYSFGVGTIPSICCLAVSHFRVSSVLWQLLTKQEPFADISNMGQLIRDVLELGARPAIPADTHPSLRELIQDCWEADPMRRPPFSSIVKRLDLIIVDCAIRDPHANLFWKERFLTKDDVRWREFINLFGEFIGLTTPGSLPILDLISINHHKVRDTSIPIDLRCFKAVLMPNSSLSSAIDAEDEDIHLERFGAICDWFGPLKSNVSVLERIREILRLGWFHGDIDTQEAENRLVGKDAGTFLVRFSTSAPGAFAISKGTQLSLLLFVFSGLICRHSGIVQFLRRA